MVTSTRSPYLAMLVAAAVCALGGVSAFCPARSPPASVGTTTTELEASRRDVFLGLTAAVTAGLTAAPRPAAASYSAYSNREKDWQERGDRGEIKVSSARELRKQLQEIAPMNDEGRSRIFCPNGPSAAVSPLMENKCGDRMAAPSVYGRQNDALGNSIPGFSSGYDYSGVSAISTGVAFPKYKENEFMLRER